MSSTLRPIDPPAFDSFDDDVDHLAGVDAGVLAERVLAATELLEGIVADRSILARLGEDERMRLLAAAGQASRPDALERRRLVKASKRERRAARIAREEAVLSETGIRKLRREPVFLTPNLFAPVGFDHQPASLGAGAVEDAAAEVAAPNGVVLNAVTGDVAEDVASPGGWMPNGEADGAPRTSAGAAPVRNCYICKRDYDALHHFYDQLCAPCAALNYRKRTETADLTGRVALLTGGRVKIGYQAGIKLLRAGAHLIVTTRFPRDSAARYAQEPDFAQWAHRLEIFGLDLRHTPSVEAFCRELVTTRDRLDFIVNNACQTVRRPPDFYAHMMAGETAALHAMPAHARQLLGAYEGMRGERLLPDVPNGSLDGAPNGVALPAGAEVAGLTHAAALSQLPLLAEELEARGTLFPAGRLDQDLQQVDLRDRNSWRMQLDEVPSVELLEVQLVNAVAPFLLNARLKPLMLRTPERDKHVVNVSAMEGQFYRRFKTTRHPHTNMAKAALNMMTRTSAADYVRDGIHMNSVDTGWVTDEDPAEIAARKVAEHRFHPPLDIVDGAARIVDPIIDGVNTGVHVWGQFLKDYTPTDW